MPASTTTIVPQEDTPKDEQAAFTPQTVDSIQPNEETCTTTAPADPLREYYNM